MSKIIRSRSGETTVTGADEMQGARSLRRKSVNEELSPKKLIGEHALI